MILGYMLIFPFPVWAGLELIPAQTGKGIQLIPAQTGKGTTKMYKNFEINLPVDG